MSSVNNNSNTVQRAYDSIAKAGFNDDGTQINKANGDNVASVAKTEVDALLQSGAITSSQHDALLSGPNLAKLDAATQSGDAAAYTAALSGLADEINNDISSNNNGVAGIEQKASVGTDGKLVDKTDQTSNSAMAQLVHDFKS